MSIVVLKEDITRLSVDAIVNVANTSLLGGGSVDGAVHGAASAAPLEARRLLGGAETRSAKITRGFNLPAKWVIHAVGPILQGGTLDESILLTRAY